MEFPAHPLWDFSLALYGRPGVADACLRLQDGAGLDVNLLLFACWTGASGGGLLATEDWRRLIDGTESWRRQVVEPLRAVRRHLKEAESPPQAAALRKRALALELDAEHAEQLTIVGIAEGTGDGAVRPADISGNLDLYVAVMEIALSGAGRADLALLAEQAALIGKM